MSDLLLVLIALLLFGAAYTALEPSYGRRHGPLRGYALPALLFLAAIAVVIVRVTQPV